MAIIPSRFKIRYLVAIILAALFTFFCGVLYFYWSVSDLIEERLNLDKTSFVYKNSEDYFEEGSRSAFQQVSTYLRFSQRSKDMRIWLKENKVEQHGRDLKFTENVIIPALKINDCKQDRCFQIKTPFYEIPNIVKQALIGVEDLRFLSHKGVDLKAVFRAIIIDVKEMKLVQGASTITQQVVKNLILSQEKTLVRKIKEVLIALYVERHLSKEQILNLYFNEIYWGSLGGVRIKGIAAACNLYFEKPLNQIGEYEAAIMISLLKGPYYYHPIKQTERLRKRADVLYNKLQESSLVSKISKKWSDEQWGSWREKLIKVQSSKDYLILSRLASEVKQKSQVSDFEKFIIEKQVVKTLASLEKKPFTAKVFIKDLSCKDCAEPFFYYSSYERDQDAALKEEKHSIGSVIKPIIYSHLFENGINEQQLFSTGPIKIKLISSVWKPRESSKRVPDEVSPEIALRRSLNRPLLRMVELVGYESVEGFLKNYFQELKTPLRQYPSQIIGAIEVSLRDLAFAYEKFFKAECEKQKLESVDLDLEEELENEKYSASRIMSNHQNSTLKYALDKRLHGLKFFGKTGTTNSGFDTWFVGFDGKKLAIIWVGWEGNRDKKQDFRNFGSTTAFPIYQNWVLNRGKRYREFHCESI